MKFDALTFTEKKNRIINAQTTPKDKTANFPSPEGLPTAGVVRFIFLKIEQRIIFSGLRNRFMPYYHQQEFLKADIPAQIHW